MNPSDLRTILLPLFATTLSAALGAQIPPGHIAVVTNNVPAGGARLLSVDPTTGATTAMSFPSGNATVQAVGIDPIDGDVIVAVSGPPGASRLVRLRLRGAAVVRETALGALPGRCEQIDFGADFELLLLIGDGGSPGVWRMPRLGGSPSLAFARSAASAAMVFPGNDAMVLAHSGTTTPATEPGIGYVDVLSGNYTFGPFAWTGFLPLRTTGVIDLPTGAARQLVSHGDGTLSVFTMGASSLPAPLPTIPALPPGGAVAMRETAALGSLLLGGAAQPLLFSFQWQFQATLPLQLIAGPFPGDPVDFDVARSAGPRVLAFGRSCSTTGVRADLFTTPGAGAPTVGNAAFALQATSGPPGALAVWTLGFDDAATTTGFALPVVLPSGCLLRVDPLAAAIAFFDPSGTVVLPLPLPPNPAIAGTRLFAQTLYGASIFDATNGLALSIF